MIRLLTGLFGALLLLVPGPARATTVLDQPIAALSKASPLIVRGVVAVQETRWNGEHTRLYTLTTVKVTAALKGRAGQSIVIRQVGGTQDGLVMAIPGSARFHVGEEIVAFLERHPTVDGEFVLVGMSAAKFTISETSAGVVVERDLSDLSFARMGPDGRLRASEPSGPARLPLEQLLETIATSQR